MLVHPQFDPVAVHIGPFKIAGHVFGPFGVHWYGLMYLLGFVAFLVLASRRVRQPQYAHLGWTSRDVEDLLFYGVLGVVLGGRLGYVLFYKPDFYFAHPLAVFQVWEGGMSFHGGLLGVITAMATFARARAVKFFDVADLVAPCVPIGLAAGRLGNFINGELWGRPADPSLPWAMVFPQAPDLRPRHPSELYELCLEGLLLFALMWWYSSRPRRRGQVSGAFLLGYGTFRFIAEYFREPDSFLGLLALHMSMGQWLCVPMILSGALLWGWASRHGGADAGAARDMSVNPGSETSP